MISINKKASRLKILNLGIQLCKNDNISYTLVGWNKKDISGNQYFNLGSQNVNYHIKKQIEIINTAMRLSDQNRKLFDGYIKKLESMHTNL